MIVSINYVSLNICNKIRGYLLGLRNWERLNDNFRFRNQ